MALVNLERSDIALFSDPIGTRVEIPYLSAFTPNVALSVAKVRFEGNTYPTAIRGEGIDRTMRLECTFPRTLHSRALALERLILRAYSEEGDGRLQLRTNAGEVEGLDPLEIIVVTGYVPSVLVARHRTLSFDAFRVHADV